MAMLDIVEIVALYMVRLLFRIIADILDELILTRQTKDRLRRKIPTG